MTKANEKLSKAEEKARAKRAYKAAHGKCDGCSKTWGPLDDLDGWEYDTQTKRWIRCPACRAYKRAIARAKRTNPDLYWEWFACTCKQAFDNNLIRVGPHTSGCRSRRL